MDENVRCNHNIIVENRKKLTFTGIKNVLSFDDETLLLDSVMGKITVKGAALHINNYDTNSGELTAEGKLYAIAYVGEEKNGGFFSRLLR
jgi:sporulation protein YabP